MKLRQGVQESVGDPHVNDKIKGVNVGNNFVIRNV